ncbi:amidase family protein [Teichococcus oryzae]|uniref:Amidase family protein n=1 Tax=Teichococcus oryzae TaxID=1608942 RepID=A0A5B2TKQ6_9PROT|nr:amidase family protein [Pseudoroseomonas oryzae]KAA2214498.1 amidase family protein [Pseudoroseomonas oryzae]
MTNDLWRLSATEIASRIAARTITARQATESALARQAAVNPAINAVVAAMPEEALAAADAVDAALARGATPGPLAGVPVTVKVNMDQKGHATTNGLRIQRDLIAATDNPVVANLRKAGAVIIGRTNTPAFSLRWFTRNSLHGATRNPRNPALTPGGSSGGAGAAVAAGIGAIAHGTDIAGSIRFPAYVCGVHGLRPSLGRIPAWNASGPERAIGAQIMAVSGPLARSVADLRLALQAMSAEDAHDPWWVPAPLEGPALPKRAALCVRPEGLNTDPALERALRQAALALQEAGWSIVETPCPPLREPARLQAHLWMAEFRRNGAAAVAREGDPDASFIYAQMERLAGPCDLDGFHDALQARAGLVRQWQLFLRDYPLLLLPPCGELPFPDMLDVSSPEAFERVVEAQLPQIALPLMGVPALTLATGQVEGPHGAAPVGVQLVAGRFREDVLLAAGALIEAASPPVTACDPA